MGAVAAYAHRGIFLRNRQAGDHFGHVAMEVSVQANEIGNAGKLPHGLAHDVDGDGCVQWCEGLVALHLFNQCGSDALVCLNCWAARNHSVADGRR